ncbi:hypothetical protein CERSUDRAFT_118270 [Gelatoporia subvermispora B]|uniref:Uncharacterized protein n=1 Tax=Ceriporiopsis subvermispora (strain B) TaxID=914234 RepID=M2PC40_CERS8|nr:hypothetical protein CERSUDRAFT_118270 [Gelatoporia subvermispora B]
MAPAAHRRRFENSLDLTAARPEFGVELIAPSGTDNAWSIDSPTLGWIIDAPSLSPVAGPSSSSACTRGSSSLRASSTMAAMRVPSIPTTPAHVKKTRRRALISGVHLVLPRTPLPPPTPGGGPHTALTFTAEWDASQHEFFFTPLCESAPKSSCSPGPSATTSTTAIMTSPVPFDVDEADYFEDPRRSLSPAVPRSAPITKRFKALSPCSARPIPRSASPSSGSVSSSSSKSSNTSHEPSSPSSPPTTAPTSFVDDLEKSKAYGTLFTSQMSASLLVADMRRTIGDNLEDAFDASCLDGVDEDVLSSPWLAFHKQCYETTFEHCGTSPTTQAAVLQDIDITVACSQLPEWLDKPLPDAPIDPIDDDTIEVDRGAVRSFFLAEADPVPLRKRHMLLFRLPVGKLFAR